MAEDFPELRVVKGSVLIPGIGGLTYLKYAPDALAHPERFPTTAEASHWWCLAPDGTILDPSGDQFTKVLKYRPELVHEVIQPRPAPPEAGRASS
jgi:hypothetical protein